MEEVLPMTTDFVQASLVSINVVTEIKEGSKQWGGPIRAQFQQKFSVSNASQGTSERGDPEDELITGDE